jgi:hypothetical protein
MNTRELHQGFKIQFDLIKSWINDVPREILETSFPHPADPKDQDVLRASIVEGEPDSDWYDFPIGKRRYKISNDLLQGYIRHCANMDIGEMQRTTMIHLFILHEVYHLHQDLTSERYKDIDEAPISLQLTDYRADAYSILACYQFYTYFDHWQTIHWQSISLGDASWCLKLSYLIQSALRSLEIFDTQPAGYNHFEMKYHRFTRYATWHFQAARAANFWAEDTDIDDFLLPEWPVIEFEGLEGPENDVKRNQVPAKLKIFIGWADRIYRHTGDTPLFGENVVDGILTADYSKSDKSFRELFKAYKEFRLPNRSYNSSSRIKSVDSCAEVEKQQGLLKDLFQGFFGKSCIEKDFHLVCSKRTLSHLASQCFEYPFARDLLINPKAAKDRAKIIHDGTTLELMPLPNDVKAWLAYEDMIVASRMGRLFGSMCGRQVQIDLDNDEVDWTESPTIAVGLGFTLHTRKLLDASGLNQKVSIEWTDDPLTDAINFDGQLYNGAQADHDFAIVARVICAGSNIHFICAGRTAPGTAAAGRFLQERWVDIAEKFSSSEDMAKKSFAVLIKHPPQTQQVCSVRIDLLTPVCHVFV